jgi:hypothetical protein
VPRFRFTVRRMMVAVAIVGICVWGEWMRRASVAHRERAEHFRLLGLPSSHTGVALLTSAEERRIALASAEARERRFNRYYEFMIAKYERAARYPWLPVEPDPPEPE